MINFDDVTEGNKQEPKPNWPGILDHSYRILIVGGSGLGKPIALCNLIHQQPVIYNSV